MSEGEDKVVYLHKDKEGIVRYVGSGTVKRACDNRAVTDRGNRYADFVKSNGRLEIEIVAEGLSKLQAERLERELYDEYIETILNTNRPSSAKVISKDMFEEYLYYDETSKSCLRWKTDMVAGNKKANSEAGSLNKSTNYYIVGLQGERYRAHRVVCVLHGFEVGGKVIDHIDRDRTNNKISNLRVVTQKENNQNKNNQKLSSRNLSGTIGVHYCKRNNAWVASWIKGGKLRCKYFTVSKYTSSEEALKAAIEYRLKMVHLWYN